MPSSTFLASALREQLQAVRKKGVPSPIRGLLLYLYPKAASSFPVKLSSMNVAPKAVAGQSVKSPEENGTHESSLCLLCVPHGCFL